MNDTDRSADARDGPISAPFLPLDSFFVRGNDFMVSTSQDVFVMAASHAHSHIEVNYFLAGEVTYRHGGRRATFRPGDLALFWGAIPHQTVTVAPGSRYVCIYLPLEMFLNAKLSGALRSAALGGGMIAAERPDQFDAQRFRRLVEDVKSPPDPRLAELVAAEVLLLVQRLDVTGWHDVLAGQHREGRAAAGVIPQKVVEMTRFIAGHGHEAISVADVARAAGLHPNYAMTRFRTTLGMTIAHYILRHRMMTAQSLLVSTKKDLAAIAFETGFGSVSQFHRSFRAHFACTPAVFRRRASLPRGGSVGGNDIRLNSLPLASGR